MEYPSKLIEEAVNQVSKLPGIGKKSALRIVLQLIKEKKENTFALTEALTKLRSNIQYCKHCHVIADQAECSICTGIRRDKSILCIVEDTKDIMAIENTGQYTGLYHVLKGVISPLQGIGPAELTIDSLIERVSKPDSIIKEIILALSPTMEGDTTSFYLHKKLKEFPVKITVISRGIPIGGDLEYADEITLGRSISSRTLFS
ncbi:MAG: recombination mediator RecR [Cyclobacteriaceae bacterium]|jgi:recombination protein RecR|nr:recombination mediator RecR [Flammeovirgaceae bacterium]MCZ8022989.1 recombination mediator RecR [Cytophagales bacterium]MCZ8327365.1 recombination mediator RecR [Cyclobacteriaceae bacterium]